MIDAAAFATAYGGLQTAFGLLKGLNAANTQVQINEVKIALQQAIFDAQNALSLAREAESASASRIADLEQEVMRLKDWSAEKQRYEFKRYHPGSVARVLKPAMANGEPVHRLCAHCFDRGEKGYLNPTNEMVRRCRVHRCSSCKGEIAMGEELPNDAPAVVAEPEPEKPRVIRYPPSGRI